jgi:hypothetical protein
MIRNAPKVSEVLARRIAVVNRAFGQGKHLGGSRWTEGPEAKRLVRRARGLSDAYLTVRADEEGGGR